jgi:phage terminase large subunit-like protein
VATVTERMSSESISRLHPHLAWIYDGSPIPDPLGKGEAAVKFIKALKHPKSRLNGQKFELNPWQERITRRVFGDVNPDGTRKIRELLMIIGRGNRKTSLMAAYMLLFLVGPERRPYSEIMSAANSREQAGHIFKEMAAICRATPELFEAVDIQPTAKAITYRKHQTRYYAISSDAKNAHGYTPIAACIDELAEAPKDELIEAIETGLNKSANTILFLPTTAGVGQLGPLYEKYSHAKKIISGQIKDDSFLPLLFETPIDADWESDDWLLAANPGFPHGYPDWEGTVRFRERCKTSPSERAKYERRHLCKWLDGAANPEWDLAIWDEGHGEIDLEALRGRRAWIGVDLSRRIDLSAVACTIELDDERFALHVKGFSPEAQLRRRAAEDSAPYTQWRDEGWLIGTDGDIVDYATVEAYIRRLVEMFDVHEVVFDIAMAREMMESLERDGIPVAAFPQTLMNFAKPVDTFEDMFLNRRLVHDSPLLRWAVGNTVMLRDQNDNRRPAKNKSADRIDPCVAAIMSVSRAAQGASGRSSYDDAPAGAFYYV